MSNAMQNSSLVSQINQIFSGNSLTPSAHTQIENKPKESFNKIYKNELANGARKTTEANKLPPKNNTQQAITDKTINAPKSEETQTQNKTVASDEDSDNNENQTLLDTSALLDLVDHIVAIANQPTEYKEQETSPTDVRDTAVSQLSSNVISPPQTASERPQTREILNTALDIESKSDSTQDIPDADPVDAVASTRPSDVHTSQAITASKPTLTENTLGNISPTPPQLEQMAALPKQEIPAAKPALSKNTPDNVSPIPIQLEQVTAPPKQEITTAKQTITGNIPGNISPTPPQLEQMAAPPKQEITRFESAQVAEYASNSTPSATLRFTRTTPLTKQEFTSSKFALSADNLISDTSPISLPAAQINTLSKQEVSPASAPPVAPERNIKRNTDEVTVQFTTEKDKMSPANNGVALEQSNHMTQAPEAILPHKSMQPAFELNSKAELFNKELTQRVTENKIVLPDHNQMNLSATSSPVLTAPPLPLGTAINNLAATQMQDFISPRVGAKGWDQALGQKMIWMVAGEESSVQLSLNPPDLGPLQVVLSVNDNQIDASFVSAHLDVREAIEAASPKLKEMMENAGISLSGFSVSAQAQSSDHAFAQAQQQRSMTNANNPAKLENSNTENSSLHQTRSPVSTGKGLVDTFV